MPAFMPAAAIEILIKSGASRMVMAVDVGTVRKLSDIQLPFFVDGADLKYPAPSTDAIGNCCAFLSAGTNSNRRKPATQPLI
jgi:hypothetical protein